MDAKPMDIVDRLRSRNNATDDIAIAEIERLRAENAELRGMLKTTKSTVMLFDEWGNTKDAALWQEL